MSNTTAVAIVRGSRELQGQVIDITVGRTNFRECRSAAMELMFLPTLSLIKAAGKTDATQANLDSFDGRPIPLGDDSTFSSGDHYPKARNPIRKTPAFEDLKYDVGMIRRGVFEIIDGSICYITAEVSSGDWGAPKDYCNLFLRADSHAPLISVTMDIPDHKKLTTKKFEVIGRFDVLEVRDIPRLDCRNANKAQTFIRSASKDLTGKLLTIKQIDKGYRTATKTTEVMVTIEDQFGNAEQVAITKKRRRLALD